MSGRPYARNHDGSNGSATDVNAYLPHQFTLRFTVPASPKWSGIKRAILQRRNEKKAIEKVRLDDEKASLDACTGFGIDELKSSLCKKPGMEHGSETKGLVEKLLALKKRNEELLDLKHQKFSELKDILIKESRLKRRRADVSTAVPAHASEMLQVPHTSSTETSNQ